MIRQKMFKHAAAMAAATLLLFGQAQAAEMADTITVASSAFEHHTPCHWRIPHTAVAQRHKSPGAICLPELCNWHSSWTTR